MQDGNIINIFVSVISHFSMSSYNAMWTRQHIMRYDYTSCGSTQNKISHKPTFHIAKSITLEHFDKIVFSIIAFLDVELLVPMGSIDGSKVNLLI